VIANPLCLERLVEQPNKSVPIPTLPPWGLINNLPPPARIGVKEEETATITVTKRVTKTKSKSVEIEYPCVMYGVQLWPKTKNWQTYTYRQCRAAQWIFRDLLNLVQDSTTYPTPSTKARHIRFAMRGFAGASTDWEVTSLVRAIATAMEENPTAECFPIIPLPAGDGW
jgi:hypothetical protein